MHRLYVGLRNGKPIIWMGLPKTVPDVLFRSSQTGILLLLPSFCRNRQLNAWTDLGHCNIRRMKRGVYTTLLWLLWNRVNTAAFIFFSQQILYGGDNCRHIFKCLDSGNEVDACISDKCRSKPLYLHLRILYKINAYMLVIEANMIKQEFKSLHSVDRYEQMTLYKNEMLICWIPLIVG